MTICPRCDNCPVREQGICSALDREQLLAFSAITRGKFVEAGQSIFRQGDETQFYAIVVSGAVKLTKTHSNGQQSIIGLLFASDFAGRLFKPEHTYSAEAATDVRICQFPRDGFLRLLDMAPGLERRLFEAVSNQLSASCDWAMLLRQPQAVQRVAGFLHFMATHAVPALRSKTAGAGRARFQLPLARREIAEFLGVSKETVSRQMTIMRALSVIDLISRRDVAVRDLDLLAGLAANGTGGDDAGCEGAEAVRGSGAAVCQGYH